MTYRQAEQIVVEVLRQALLDLKSHTRKRDNIERASAIAYHNHEIVKIKNYIQNGLHREIVESNPSVILERFKESGVRNSNWDKKIK